MKQFRRTYANKIRYSCNKRGPTFAFGMAEEEEEEGADYTTKYYASDGACFDGGGGDDAQDEAVV